MRIGAIAVLCLFAGPAVTDGVSRAYAPSRPIDRPLNPLRLRRLAPQHNGVGRDGPGP